MTIFRITETNGKGHVSTFYVSGTKAPEFNEKCGRWYVWGNRWIKSREAFSGTVLLHSGQQCDEVPAVYY